MIDTDPEIDEKVAELEQAWLDGVALGLLDPEPDDPEQWF